MPDQSAPNLSPAPQPPESSPPSFDRPAFSDQERRAYEWIHERLLADLHDLLHHLYTSDVSPKEPGSPASQTAKGLMRDLVVAHNAIHSKAPLLILNAHWLPCATDPRAEKL